MPTSNDSSQPTLPTLAAGEGISEQPPGSAGACCTGWRTFCTGIVGALVATACVGAFVAGRYSADNGSTDVNLGLPLIDATAAVSSDAYSIATGPVSDRAEGLFVLDHNSGLLQCQVLYPRVGKFAASFQVNVSQALGNAGKGGKYLMVTGNAQFQGAGNQAPAPSVVYILDTASGNYACYAIPFNRVAQNARQPQAGTMQLIAQGVANMVPDRDALR